MQVSRWPTAAVISPDDSPEPASASFRRRYAHCSLASPFSAFHSQNGTETHTTPAAASSRRFRTVWPIGTRAAPAAVPLSRKCAGPSTSTAQRPAAAPPLTQMSSASLRRRPAQHPRPPEAPPAWHASPSPRAAPSSASTARPRHAAQPRAAQPLSSERARERPAARRAGPRAPRCKCPRARARSPPAAAPRPRFHSPPSPAGSCRPAAPAPARQSAPARARRTLRPAPRPFSARRPPPPAAPRPPAAPPPRRSTKSALLPDLPKNKNKN